MKKMSLGRDLAAVLAETELIDDEAREWHVIGQQRATTLKPPADK
jgi:hypothetical protein